MTTSISTDEAQRLLASYHFTPTDVSGVVARLGTVQYDPLNPVGRNPDLVLQARVADYRVDDWQSYAYSHRLAYDAWDKQACLVPTEDWPKRELIRRDYHPWHDREILAEHPEMAGVALREIDTRGPLSSLEFEDRTHKPDGNSWLGPTRIKRVLRALWARGIIVTHHRAGGRHYYDRPARVIPREHFTQPPLLDSDAYHRWIVYRRHQAAGMLRPTASAEIWSVCGTAAIRAQSIADLVDSGDLTPVRVGLKKTLYHVPTPILHLLNAPSPHFPMIFLGPLDNLLWDRKAIREIFQFDYMWEVYKREPDRIWGYYVLPVFYKDRFVGRLDSRLEGQTWTIYRWWWEEGVVPDTEMLDALRQAVLRFLAYLGAKSVRVMSRLDRATRSAITARAG